jgi:glucose/arabinose dehydrogenase
MKMWLRFGLLTAILAFSCVPSAGAQQLRARLITSSLSAPIAFVQHPTRSNVQLVVQQGGVVRVLQSGSLTGQTFMDLSDEVTFSGEQGLLGLAFPPNFSTTGRVFVNFVDTSGNIVVARFNVVDVDDDNLRVDMNSRFDLVWPGDRTSIQHPEGNHNGGNLAFGPDGFLYIGIGDGGGGNDPQKRAQNPTLLLGKMLRINVGVSDTHSRGYSIPSDNPFDSPTDGVLDEIWAFGLRNPWRWSFDDPELGGTGALVIGDVGQGSWEEIDYEPEGRGGRNYGWRIREGSHSNFSDTPASASPTLTNPLFEYGRAEGSSITGGFVYRGAALGSNYFGRYFFADYGSSRVWSLGLNISGSGSASVANVTEHTSDLGLGKISSFGVDGEGELYAVVYSGSVHRIESRNPSTPPATGCVTNSPGPGWVCVGSGWLPPGHPLAGGAPPPPPPPTCTTPQPGPGYTCVNGSWVAPPVQTGCTNKPPAANWVCIGNNGWVPPNHPLAVGAPPPPPTCTAASPGPGYTCVNGNWVAPPPPPSQLPVCSPSLGRAPASGWIRVGSGWVPPGHPLAAKGTCRAQ